MEELSKAALKRLSEVMIEYEEFGKLEDIQRALRRKLNTLTADEISRAIVKIGIYLIRIGELVVMKASNYEVAKSIRKREFLKEYASSDSTLRAYERENIANRKTSNYITEEIVNNYVHDYIKMFYTDYSRLCSILQSRLNAMRDERINMTQQV